MRIVSTSYSKTETFSDPALWLEQISFYTGLLEELTNDHQVDSFERISYTGSYRKSGVTYHFMPQREKVVRFPWRMHRRISRLDPDVVMVNGFIFPLQILQLRLAVGRRARILVLHRAEKPFTGYKKWLQMLGDRCVDAYLFASAEFGKPWLDSGVIRNKEKIHEVLQSSSPFLSGEIKSAPTMQDLPGDPIYLWVGRLEKNKDPLTVVNTFLRFALQKPTARLYMIFQTEELLDEVKNLIRESGAKDSIHLIGKVPRKELGQWYNRADFIVSGSHYEGSGIAVVEAMSCGCIPLVTDIVSFRSITGGTGLLYPAGSADELLSTLQKSLLLDREAQRSKVMAQFQNELSFPALAQKINRLLAGK